jgi:hypothetical protein
MRRILLVLMIIGVVAISGCLNGSGDGDGDTISTDPQERCIQVCREKLQAGINLNEGPCLSEDSDVDWDVEDWACDVAHNPRKNIDNSAINQCQRWRTQKVTHFVEVTPNCEFIQKE